MREIEIGTILAEVSPTTNLKHFIVYDKEGRTVWATDGYKDAEIVKKTNNYFVIFADNNYLAFYCKEINFETGMYIFYEGNYKSFLEYQELIDFEKSRKTRGLSAHNENDVTKKVVANTESLEEFKLQVERKAQDLQKQMRETELQYKLSVGKIKKDYEEKLAQYKRMNSIEALMENKESFDKIQKEADEYKQKYLNKKEEVEDLTNKIQSLGEIQKDEVDALTRKIQFLEEDLDLYKNDNPELVRLIESTEVNEESLQYTVVSLNHTIRQKEKIINDYSKNLKIIFAVNIFLLAMLIYAITLIG